MSAAAFGAGFGTLWRRLHGYGSKGQQSKPGGAAALVGRRGRPYPSSPNRMPLTAGAREIPEVSRTNLRAQNRSTPLVPVGLAASLSHRSLRSGAHLRSLARMNRDGRWRPYFVFSLKTTPVCGFT